MSDDASGARSARPTSPAPRVVFIHIPKTAGSTLRKVLRSNGMNSARLPNVFKGRGGRLKEPDYERMAATMRANAHACFFWGHTPFAVASYMPPQWETDFITFLRDPVERAISHYYHMVDRLVRRDTDANDGDNNAVRGSPPKETVIRGHFTLDVPYDVALADAGFVSDNLQTRLLCGLPRPFGEVTDEMLERAIENLGRFRCVGLTERFDESLVLLKHRIDYQSILYDDQRVNSSRPRGASVPEELRRAAEKANSFDRELYRHAVAQFESAPELGDLDFRIDVAALRSARSGGEAQLPEAPAELAPEGPPWSELLAQRRELLGELRARARTRRRDPPVRKPDAARPSQQAQGGHRQSLRDSGAMTDAPKSELTTERRRRKMQRGEAAQQQNAEPDETALKEERRKQRFEDAQRHARAQEEREPPIAFVHIPKTAGGTLKSVFADAFGRKAVQDSGNYPRNPEGTAAKTFKFGPGVRITIGHVPYGLFRSHLPPDTRYITFLREPVERVISHYYRHLDGKVGTRTLAEALERGVPDVTNLMTRFLCGHGHPEVLDALPATAVEDAKAVLESFFFVGFQDRFDASLVVLQERLGMPMTAYGVTRHVNADRPSFGEVGEENLALIEMHNQLDVELYAWARGRFGGDFDARSGELAGAVETMRGAITEKTVMQEVHMARALQWLTEQVPPGTERHFKELCAAAEQIGITTRDLNLARRQMNPPSRKFKKHRGGMLVVAAESDGVDRSTRKAAKKKQQIHVAASPEGEAAAAAAAEWLQERLPPGTSRRKGDLVAAARQAGVPGDALRRAAQKLNLYVSLDQEGGKLWTLGDAQAQEGEAVRPC